MTKKENSERKFTNWIVFIGPPNVGKSTLVNRLVGEKVSIVTPKAQTTRSSLKGIRVEGSTQLVFIDTPGIFEAKTRNEKILVNSAWQTVNDADEICLMLDVKKALLPKNLELLQHINKRSIMCNLVINKIDLLPKPKLLDMIAQLNQLCDFKNIFLISALNGDGVDKLFDYFMATALPKPWLFDEDDFTDAPLHFMVSEIVREKIIFNTHQEVPYNVYVQTDHWEKKENIEVININIFVTTESHKKILIGKDGSLLKRIGTQARKEIERLVDKKIYLGLHIKVIDQTRIKHPNYESNK